MGFAAPSPSQPGLQPDLQRAPPLPPPPPPGLAPQRAQGPFVAAPAALRGKAAPPRAGGCPMGPRGSGRCPLGVSWAVPAVSSSPLSTGVGVGGLGGLWGLCPALG